MSFFNKIKQILKVEKKEEYTGFNVIGRRRWWYFLSAFVLLPGLIALSVAGLRLGIDFTGGTVVELRNLQPETVREVAIESGINNPDIRTSPNTVVLRHREEVDSASEEENINNLLSENLEKAGAEIARLDVVGPSISRDITRKAFLAVAIMSLAIVIYIAWSFRNMPPPMRSVIFGVAAVIALLHDALFVLGMFAIFGLFLGIELDVFFVTAILTVIGFSVHDTIVVFDRIREDLHRYKGEFDEIVNRSINEVMVRSLNTSFTTILVLLGLFIFGGNSIKYFVLALLLGMAAGTYSSIFIASPLLVTWRNLKAKK
ncbi:MAG: protein translocase subunit SecF [Candidatus Saccharimonadales bacterium]